MSTNHFKCGGTKTVNIYQSPAVSRPAAADVAAELLTSLPQVAVAVAPPSVATTIPHSKAASPHESEMLFVTRDGGAMHDLSARCTTFALLDLCHACP